MLRPHYFGDTGCGSDADCGIGWYCGWDGSCYRADAGCGDDFDCPSGYYCYSDGNCYRESSPCDTITCGPGYYCDEGTGWCTPL